MISERRRLANQRNAQKSTGPRTAEGKERSRRNALKHGLAGMGSILPPGDERLFQDRLHAWTGEERPEGELDSYLLATAVLASVRVDRCARHEFAAIDRKRRAALRNWQRRQDRKIDRLTQALETDPAGAVGKLEAFASGCGWMLEQWQDLAQALDQPGHWTDAQARLAARLLGHDPDGPHAAGSTPAALVENARILVAEGETDRHEPARNALRHVAADEIERLTALRHELWFEDDGPALAEEINLATIDTSHEAALRHRYAVAADLAMHRSLNQLARRERLAAQARKGEPAESSEPGQRSFDPAGDHNNELCEWLRRGGQKQAQGQAEAPTPTPTPTATPTATAEPAPVAPAAATRNEATAAPSSSDETGTCGTDPSVTTPAPEAAFPAHDGPQTAAEAPLQEVEAAAPGCPAP